MHIFRHTIRHLNDGHKDRMQNIARDAHEWREKGKIMISRVLHTPTTFVVLLIPLLTEPLPLVI